MADQLGSGPCRDLSGVPEFKLRIRFHQPAPPMKAIKIHKGDGPPMAPGIATRLYRLSKMRHELLESIGLLPSAEESEDALKLIRECREILARMANGE